MSHKKLSPFNVKVSVLGYFPLPVSTISSCKFRNCCQINFSKQPN